AVNYHHWFVRAGGRGKIYAKQICGDLLNIDRYTTPLETGKGCEHTDLHSGKFTWSDAKMGIAESTYDGVVEALYKFFAKQNPKKTRCCKFLTFMSGFITAAYSAATCKADFPPLYNYNSPNRRTDQDFVLMLAKACGKEAAK